MEYLDLDLLEERREILAEELPPLIREFLDDVTRDIESIRRGMTDGEWEEVQALAHRIKGSAANLGAEALSAAAADLTTRCRNGQYEATADSAESLVAITMATREAFRDQGLA